MCILMNFHEPFESFGESANLRVSGGLRKGEHSMPAAAENAKNELIRKITREARQKLRKGRSGEIERFIVQYFARIPMEDLAGRKPADLLAMVQNHWHGSTNRKPSKAVVRAFNPTVKEHGYESMHTVVEITTDDMPFLVDSVASEINRVGLEAHLIIHPVLKVRRTRAGKMQEILEPGVTDTGSRTESFMHLEVTCQSGARLAEIEPNIERVLTDVRSAVEDWRPMRERMVACIDELQRTPRGLLMDEVAEVREFLRWIHDNHFTFLGFREYDLKGKGRTSHLGYVDKTGLGVLRDPNFSVFQNGGENGAESDVAILTRYPGLLLVTKANQRSTVHRAVHMDAIGVRRLDDDGRVIGYLLFVGLFTAGAYHRRPTEIPLLRRRVQIVLEKAGFDQSSHDGKALTNILDNYPRDELFQIDDDLLVETALGILHLQERQRTALFTRHDELSRYVSCLVFIPRDRYNTELRHRIQEILAEELQGRVSAFFTQLDESALARCHIIVPMTTGHIPQYDHERIEARLVQAARSWGDRLGDALTRQMGEEEALNVRQRWEHAFGAGYRDRYNADEVISDIAIMEQMIVDGGIGMNLYRLENAAPHRVHFKIYRMDDPIPLSDVIPIFEDLGFRVIDEAGPHRITLSGSATTRTIVIHNFGLKTRDGGPVDLAAIRDNFHNTFVRAWDGVIESDGFNALVARGGLEWREVLVLRAYCKYLRQAGIAFSQVYMEQTMANNPAIATDIVRLFMARLDPDGGPGAKSTAGRIRSRIEKALEQVASADEDRILRRFVNVVESTLRTNFFQTGSTGKPKPYLSVKLDSRNIEELPLPMPFREIWVYSPRVEGVHLRFGLVARGGLRWSDRREDFRTEILGLVKAQQVKNAVIVPVGSKGGFVVKRPPMQGGREAFMAEGIECYKTFISGLLDLTDNIRGSRIIEPEKVVRHDGDDPYLVVAADKGTATFSDIANGVSIEYGHWLGDAFASGGSQGYDHKKMGITARGGWESVKRHFRELGKDIQKEDFTAIGVGDMSGDVFGNGMLLSKQTKVIAAFNHLHIFVDPNPDPAKSWAERKRMFDLPRSAWSDYNPKLLSKGGAIFERSAKKLKLSREIQTAFGISKSNVTPNELLRAILKAEVDLLWFGGIGTYVKASSESHLDAGDRSNDVIRVNGDELRCKVIGEGANLGCTQLGRIEFAEAGGRLNTDAIDNSAGVDSSDHEVNIKILVDTIVADGRLTEKERNTLLAKMTDEVASLVLIHNYRQTQAISLIQAQGVHVLDNQRRLMKNLEREDRLTRHVEFLPDDETISERHLAKRGLYRPEISVLISYAKIWLYDELIESDLPDDPYLRDDLIDYFPTAIRQKYATEIERHRLRREIVATRATNSLVDRVGDTFISEFMEKTGLPAAQIARAYIIAREVFELRDLWSAIESLDNKVPSSIQMAMLADINHLIDWVALWFLRNGEIGLDLGRHINEFRDGISELAAGINKAIPPHYVDDVHKRAKPYLDHRVPESLAIRIASLVNLYSGCDIVRLAARRKRSVLDVAETYFAVGTRFKMGRLRAAADTMDSDSHWQQLAVAALVEEIYAHQLTLSNMVLDFAGPKINGHNAIEAWIASHHAAVEPTDQLLTELWATEVNDLSMIAVASRQIHTMALAGERS